MGFEQLSQVFICTGIRHNCELWRCLIQDLARKIREATLLQETAFSHKLHSNAV